MSDKYGDSCIREGKRREREAICRLLLIISNNEPSNNYRGLLIQLVQIIRGRRIR